MESVFLDLLSHLFTSAGALQTFLPPRYHSPLSQHKPAQSSDQTWVDENSPPKQFQTRSYQLWDYQIRPDGILSLVGVKDGAIRQEPFVGHQQLVPLSALLAPRASQWGLNLPLELGKQDKHSFDYLPHLNSFLGQQCLNIKREN